jgi:hypothetical protein
MSKDVFSPGRLASLVEDPTQDEYNTKVLRAFMEGERIMEIPAQYKKQDVLVRWLLEKFEKGRQYPETEVNEIIKRHHPDSAWFRRSFIDRKYMMREKGIYWRIDE